MATRNREEDALFFLVRQQTPDLDMELRHGHIELIRQEELDKELAIGVQESNNQVVIGLDELRYWSVARQEPYATAAISVQAALDDKG